MRSVVKLAVALALSGCHVGPSVETFAPATGPDGIVAHLRLRHAKVDGELLEVQDTALLVLRDNPVNRIMFVPLTVIREGAFAQRGVLIVGGRPVAAGALAELRLLSRFPAGLTAQLRWALLAAYGQAEPDTAP